MSSKAAFSACKGKGIRGWVYAFDELISIRPEKFLMHNINDKISIDDAHIVYKYNDVDRSDYPHNQGMTTCGLDHILDDEHDEHDDHHNIHRNLLESDSVNQIIANSEFVSNNGIRYVELAVVNDPGMVQRYKDLYGEENWNLELQSATISIINTVQQYYLDTSWGTNIGEIQIILMAIYYISDWNDYGSNYAPRPLLNYVSSNNQLIYCDECEPSLFCNGCLGQSNYYEIDYNDYLNKFHNFRTSELKNYDNAQLFSYYDFFSTVIGLASLPGMCIQSSSGGIEQCTYDHEYNGNIVAHEMGHNFNMMHDGQNNNCDASEYIMASAGSPFGYRPNSFSSCSIEEINQYFTNFPQILSCLDNVPPETSFSVCGNGIVEQGETCDCGTPDCTQIDRCCDGIICSLYGDAQCSNLDECCQDCNIKGSNELCRPLSTTNTCDIEEEYCDGISSQCPYDTRKIEGEICNVINSHYQGLNISYGYCYDGQCVSIENQCTMYGSNDGQSFTLSTGCEYDEAWRTPNCGRSLQCGYTFDQQQCHSINGEEFEIGTPCYIFNGNDPPRQCSSGILTNQCVLSTSIYTYVYISDGWSKCSIPCRDDENNSTQIGYQFRNVYCALQDGTAVDQSNCVQQGLYKPPTNRTCNDFVCNFCAQLVEKPHICWPNGECDENAGICICDFGYGGEYCDIEPSLYFVGITSHVYYNLSDITIAERADPCDVIDDFYDISSNTQTLSVANVSSLPRLYIGSVVGIRWNSTGTLSLLSVGMIRVTQNGQEYGDTAWPFYVGVSLATDNQDCQDMNTSSYDPCYQDLSCNDFSFILPADLTPGFYKIVVRFNKEYNIQSRIFTVECTNNICNAAGNGQCTDSNEIDENVCECDENWFGNRCDESLCKEWIFTPDSCDHDVFCPNYKKPKCFGGECYYSMHINDTITNDCECNVHYNGDYCELPNDYCHQIEDEITCINEQLCLFDNTYGCIYNDCFILDDNLCLNGDRNETVTFEYNETWPIYCEWNTENGYCDRITCNSNDLQQCQNGAVRRPLFDDRSICYTWYCDCSTTPNDQYWMISTRSSLISSISSQYPWNVSLDSLYVSDIDLFTCSKCGLNCSHGSIQNEQCTFCDKCDRNKWEGVECNHLYWIGYLKLNLSFEIVVENYDEFLKTITQDLTYFFMTQSHYIIISEITSSDNDMSTVIYFKYLFDVKVNDNTIQSIGGDIMVNARNQISNEYSPSITRGFITKYTDYTFKFDWCLPTKEVCSHELEEINWWELIGYCAIVSYTFLGILVVCCICHSKYRNKRTRNKYRKQQKEAQKPLSPEQKLKSPKSPKSPGLLSLGRDKGYGTYEELIQMEGNEDDDVEIIYEHRQGDRV